MTKSRWIAFICILLSVGVSVHAAEARSDVRGVVYWDKNNNGVRDKGETGISGVCVSNGKEVVKTNKSGAYKLPAYDEMVVFVIKPSDYAPPLNEKNIPQFFYIHQPKGSPPGIKEFPGITPTGDLPRKVNFALLKVDESEDFKAIITGDTQVYTHKEIDYLRNSLVKELVGTDAPLVICMGDNVGDVLSLYPRYLSVMSQIGAPLYLVPGNHDMNYDAEYPSHAFETFKREFGPIYYSFNYGKVHFVVLNDVYYPSMEYSKPDKKTYHGEIDEQQMEWLRNDLSYVPYDHLIVLNMHIPIVSFCDRNSEQHMVANREALYALLKDRKALTLSGHTHTLEHFLPGEQEEG